MILTGHLLVEDMPGRCRLKPGAVHLTEQTIDSVELYQETNTADLERGDWGGPNCIICPGFIDAHLHLPQFGIVGAHGMPLLDWLSRATFPAEQTWEDPDIAKRDASSAIDQLVACGTTGIAAFSTVHYEATRQALLAAERAGIRGVIGQALIDRYAPPELCRTSNQLLDEQQQLLNEFAAGQRVAASIAPRFALSCSDALLEGAGKIAADHGAIIQSHLAETRQECDLVREHFGKPYVEVYRDAGLATAKSFFGHGIYLDQHDRDLLAESESKIVHCPTANEFLDSGNMNRKNLQESGVTLAIGSDIGAGYERSMVRVARNMIFTARRLGANAPSTAVAWHMITRGNADALGWSDSGRLAVGAASDLLVIEPDVEWQQPTIDPLDALMFQWDDRWIKQVLLQGRVAYQCG